MNQVTVLELINALEHMDDMDLVRFEIRLSPKRIVLKAAYRDVLVSNLETGDMEVSK